MKPEDVESQLVGESLEAPNGEFLGVFESAGFDQSGRLHASVSSDEYNDFELEIDPFTARSLMETSDSVDAFTGSLGRVVARLVHEQPDATSFQVSLQTPPGEETGPYGDPNKKPPKRPA